MIGRQPDRTGNALDVALAFLSTWAGVPRAARAIAVDPDDPLSVMGGERRGRERAEAFLRRPFTYLGPDAGAYALIAEPLEAGGHGTAALIVNGWPPSVGTGTHAWNAYNHRGRVQWVDGQRVDIRDRPIYPEPHGVWAIVVDTGWRPT